ncbi:MAG: cupredoxin domain-containing protein [Rhodospirillales bacterium]
MNTQIFTVSKYRWALIGIATATMVSAGVSSSALAAGEHQGGHMMQGGGTQSSGGHDHSFEFGMPGKASEVDRTVNIVMKDNYFDLRSIKVKADETIRFKIVNKGTFLHEFGIGTMAMHKAHQKQMMTMMDHGMITANKINHERMKMDHGPGQMMMKHDDPNSVLLEPGKSGEIIWKFTKPMKLEFACNVPGHYQSGMVGRIKFKK